MRGIFWRPWGWGKRSGALEDGKWERIHREDAKDAEKRKEFEQKEAKRAKKNGFSARRNRINRMKKGMRMEPGHFLNHGTAFAQANDCT
jgi:hypothetical protein